MKKRTWKMSAAEISEKELDKVLNDVFWRPKLDQDIKNNNNKTLED